MRIILSGILVFIGMIALQRSAMIYSDSKLKEKEGKTTLGKILGIYKLSGITTKYTVEFEFVVNEVIYTKEIVIIDKSILQYKVGEYIPLIYIEGKDRLFFVEKPYKNIIKQVLLIAFSSFAVLMASLLI